MQDLEKRIAAIEEKLKNLDTAFLNDNEKIVWNFISKNLSLFFEIRQYSKDNYALAATGFKLGLYKSDPGVWETETDTDMILLEALIALGVKVWEKKEKENE